MGGGGQKSRLGRKFYTFPQIFDKFLNKNAIKSLLFPWGWQEIKVKNFSVEESGQKICQIPILYSHGVMVKVFGTLQM